jgi:catechol 2,3-dioxygenase-like lactoylglutathione lyase family enzyme
MGGGFALHPFQLDDGSPHAAGSAEMFQRGHLDHVALDVADEATLQLLRRRLVERGATDGAVTDFGVTRSVWFSDPDGHGWEIALWQDAPPRTFDDRVVEPFMATT